MINLIMRKVTTALSLGLLTLANSAPVSAAVTLTPAAPSQGIAANTSPQTVITSVISLVFVAAILLVLFFLILGAFNWITSGGDKEKIKSARGTIVHALIGLAILALAFVIANVAGQILNVNFNNLSFNNLQGS